MVKIFTMVKDEVDIIRDWVIYHGCLFGWCNIYVIDNYSTDGTYEVLQEFKDLINIIQKPDYKLKGVYMTELMKKYSMGDDKIFFPIDIDEFIVYLEPNSKKITFDKNLIHKYIQNLPPSKVYKTNYLLSILDNNLGYERAQSVIDYALYQNYGNMAKSFFNTLYFNEIIDHGNHYPCNDYHMTNLVLVHYHFRNIEQIKKKTLNNIIGLGYNPDLQNLINIINHNPNCNGNHHIKRYIEILENRYTLFHCNNPNDDNNNINITPLKQRIIDGFY
jgi:hypothetical protein